MSGRSRKGSASSRHCSVSKCSHPTFKRGYCAEHHRAQYGSGAASSSSKSAGSSLLDPRTVGVDDMVLLPSPSEQSICTNLQTRHRSDVIYTSIGQVLVSVNPFKAIAGLYSQATIQAYSNKAPHENPPHVFALAEVAYKTMRAEEENQCVIISGESGAGKTEAAKSLMVYVSAVSGGGAAAEAVKRMILESNPLLEALGNAKTIRNNNSSRFGKYFDIKFDSSGTPRSGWITNYLLEKSRVVHQSEGERGFHIFYQLIKGAPEAARAKYGLEGGCKAFSFLNPHCHSIDDVSDEEEFAATRAALAATGFGSKEQEAIFSLVAGVLHLGNIKFKEDDKTGACRVGGPGLARAAELLGVEADALVKVLSLRHIKTAREEYDVPNNAQQCGQTRDALAKALYTRMFDWVVKRVNAGLEAEEDMPFSIGVLDIYGFEVFECNGFDNFVNEKLQQIFIELTLKSEQEEYAREGIQWKAIPFFNNRVVCELIEGSVTTGGPRLPPGIFSLLDDVCATMHAESKGSERAFTEKVASIHSSHAHLSPAGSRAGFVVQHFAGPVEYSALDFPPKNADAVSNDLVLAMQVSTKRLIALLFNEVVDLDSKKRAPTAGSKIRKQTKELVAHLMSANPHYIRTIKSNDNKRANQFDFARVLFQIKYLGLLENLRVRRAGFAYRREWHDFVKRFALLSSKTWPNDFSGSDRDAAKAILSSVKRRAPELVSKEQVQLGRTMIFVKDPETIAALDALKMERLGGMFAKFQRLWRHYKKNKEAVAVKNATALQLYRAGKERRRESFYRPYAGLYLDGWRKDEALLALLHHYEPGDRLRLVFLDRVALVSSNLATPAESTLRQSHPQLFGQAHSLADAPALAHWKREEVILAVSKEHIYVIQDNTAVIAAAAAAAAATPGAAAAAAPSAFVPAYFLRRLLPLTFLSSLSLSTLADTYIALHVQAGAMVATQPAPAWVPDADVSTCGECGEKFGLFFRRHHCRACGGIFCDGDLQRRQALPDYLETQRDAVRICAFCFGRESADFVQDLLLATEKKTELMVVIQDLFRHSPLKEIKSNFGPSITLQVREYAPAAETAVIQSRTVEFKKSSKSSSGSARGAGFDLVPSVADRAVVSVAAGLAPDFIKACQKRAEKRRAQAEKRKQAEAELRRQRNAEREAEREAERKQRLAEKKRAKAEAKAQAAAQAAAAQEAAPAGGRGAGSSSSSSRSRPGRDRPAAPSAPAVPPCATCGCDSFVANMFKKGSCNSCYHKHE